jgi:ABC-type branched-subunit amino acid transport system permease subunit
MHKLTDFPGSRRLGHALIAFVAWVLLNLFINSVDPLYNLYLAKAAMYAIALFGMVILVGLSGQVSLGNGALMAVGGYVFAVTTLNWQTVPFFGWQWNPVWAVIFAGLGGVIFGLVIGWLGARLKGPYLAGLTLGVAVGIPAIATRFPELLGGETGLQVPVAIPGTVPAIAEEFPVDGALPQDALPTAQEPLPTAQEILPTAQPGPTGSAEMLTLDDLAPGSLSGSAAPAPTADMLTPGDLAPGSLVDASPMPTAGMDVPVDVPVGDLGAASSFLLENYQAQIAVAVACIVAFIAMNLVRGRQGMVWKAVRDDPVAAAVVGISPSGAKISAFAVSSLFAALAGAVYAQILELVTPGAFPLGLSLTLLVGVVLGGRASLLGAVIGAVLLVWLPELVLGLAERGGWSEQVTNNAPNLIYGLLVVLVVLLAPGGIVGSLQSAWRKVTRRDPGAAASVS